MRLQPLLETLLRADEVRAAVNSIASSRRLTLGVSEAAASVAAALAWRASGAPALLVLPREVDAERTAELLAHWAPDAMMHFPGRGGLPYERTPPPVEVTQQRLRVLAALANPELAPLVVASVAAVAERTMHPHDLGRGPGTLRVGARVVLEDLASQLVDAGYEFSSLVDRPGLAARRGGLLDVFPPTAALPLRIELFGTDVESIRTFDPDTQRTLQRIGSEHIGPATEWFPSGEDLARVAEHLRQASGARSDDEVEEDLATVQRGELPAPARYGPLAVEGSILDHLPDEATLVLDDRAAIRAAAAEFDELAIERRAELAERGEIGRSTPLPHAAASELEVSLDRRRPLVELSRWATGREPNTARMPFAQHDAYAGRLAEAAREMARELRRGDRVVVVSQQAQRYREVLAEAGVQAEVSANLDAAPAAGTLTLVQGALEAGWRLPLPDGHVSLCTDRELFGFVKQRRTLRRPATHRSRFLSEIEPGDFVVHADHGIARFAGIVRREMNGEPRDYLQLNYAGDDRLYVPVEQVDRVTRYVGPSAQSPRLTRLGTQEWNRARARVRQAVAETAADLLRLYAARQLLRGHAFATDTEWQRVMEAAFPYEETEDQLRAIADVKADMESVRPMDRIVLGDVGFGKTEVAVRAAFKAVQDGYQVAILVPTTVLAQQHERTFRERLAPFPVRIEVLSRFRTDAEAREVIAALRAGDVDIVIGTHRLLQDGIEFANLGLVVIDEEQRFGVAHKERLKRMRLEVDVLALSATPIPRTLHMSLSGIRDMSTMALAPVDRQPVQTYVSEWDDALVREAILQEMERGGQIYFVHNRVHSIDMLAERMRALVPEARIAVGHGQLSEGLLKSVMEKFSDGEFDVLLCTTIIESGIDIPNVNTLIIDRADRMGLAQLYQLRGRVGRASHQAFAYLLHPRDHVLTETARRRLETIFEASELGAGFQVALRDLEIRGAGNLLGAEQSGQIAAVGLELYTELLRESVEELKRTAGAPADGETPAAATTPTPTVEARPAIIDLPVSAFIPESYVEEIEGRLALYQRIAGLRNVDEATTLIEETTDRFGQLPGALLRLFALVRIRLAARNAGIGAIRLDGDELVLAVRDAATLARIPRSSLPSGIAIGQTQLRMSRTALGRDWPEALVALEALLRLLAGDGPAPAAGRGGASELALSEAR